MISWLAYEEESIYNLDFNKTAFSSKKKLYPAFITDSFTIFAIFLRKIVFYDTFR